MHLLPGRRSQWEATPPVPLRYCQRQWPLVAVPSGHIPAIRKGGHDLWTVFTAPIRPWHPECLVSGPKHWIRTCTSWQKKRMQEKCLEFSCCHKAPKGECFLSWQLDRICKKRVGLCFFLFTYITYALIFFFFFLYLKWRRIWYLGCQLLCLLELSWCLGIWKKIIKV